MIKIPDNRKHYMPYREAELEMPTPHTISLLKQPQKLNVKQDKAHFI